MTPHTKSLSKWGALGCVTLALALAPISTALLDHTPPLDTETDIEAAQTLDAEVRADTDVNASICSSLRAEVTGDGHIRLHFEPLTQQTALLRAQVDATGAASTADAIAVLEAGSTTFLDGTVDAGLSYHYTLSLGIDGCLVDVGLPGRDDDGPPDPGPDPDPDPGNGGDGTGNGSAGADPSSGADDPECEAIALTSVNFEVDGEVHQELPKETMAGAQVTALLELEGCGDVEISFAAYQASADLGGHVLHDAHTQVLTEGSASLSIDVSACFSLVALVQGDVQSHVAAADALHQDGHVGLVALVEVQIACPTGGTPGDGAGDGPGDASGDLSGNVSGDVSGDASGDLSGNVSVSTCADLKATTSGDGSIRLTLDEALDTPATLLRSEAGGAKGKVLTQLAPGDTVHTDTDAEVGVAYVYTLTVDGAECAVVESTTMPVFSTFLAGGLASGIALLGYVGVRRFF